MTPLIARVLHGSPSSLVVGAFVGATAIWMGTGDSSPATSPPPAPVMRTDAVSRVARDRARSVVLLHTIVRRDPAAEPYALFVPPVSEALGTGIVIDAEGLILTNAHVIDKKADIHVRRPDGEDVPTTVVGIDRDSDVALVRVSDPTGLVASHVSHMLPDDTDIVIERLEDGRFGVRRINGPFQFSATSLDEAVHVALGLAQRDGIDVWLADENKTLRSLARHRC